MSAYVCFRICVSVCLLAYVYTYVFSFFCVFVFVLAQVCLIIVTSVFQHVSLLRDHTLHVYPTKYRDLFRLK
jgi:hypothetical protein